MAQSDADKWNKRYREQHPQFIPDAFLLNNADLLNGQGKALDLACGPGHNTIWLAEKGYAATGIDISSEGIHQAQAEANQRGLTLNLIAADLDDLESAKDLLPEDGYDVVVVIRFLHRALSAQIRQTLKRGGLLFYKTFNITHCNETNFPPDFALKPQELVNAFADFEIIETNDGEKLKESQTFLVARKK